MSITENVHVKDEVDARLGKKADLQVVLALTEAMIGDILADPVVVVQAVEGGDGVLADVYNRDRFLGVSSTSHHLTRPRTWPCTWRLGQELSTHCASWSPPQRGARWSAARSTGRLGANAWRAATPTGDGGCTRRCPPSGRGCARWRRAAFGRACCRMTTSSLRSIPSPRGQT